MINEVLRAVFLKQSETRERLNVLAAKDKPTDAEGVELTECRNKATAIEVELRKALANGDGDHLDDQGVVEDAETRERREIRSRARVMKFVMAAANVAPVDGAEAEVAEAYGCRPGHMPLCMLEERQVEHRAITPGVVLPRPTDAIAPVIFSRTAGAALGVQFPSVAAGQAGYPVLVTAPTAGTVAKDSAAPATAGAFRLDTRTPTRVTGQFEVRVEDLALLPGMESALVGSINDSMGEEIDKGLFNGGAANFTTDGNIRGLFAQASDVTADSDIETFAKGVSMFAALVDGQYANSMADLRAVIGVSTYARYASQFQSNGDVSLFDYLMGKLGGIRVSKRIPAKSSNAQKGLVARTAGSQPIRVPVWNDVQMIRDPYSEAGKGQIKVTAVMLVGSPHLPYGTSTIVEVHPKVS